jgi:formylglycine-generating enzyme required for sulfatase activity
MNEHTLALKILRGGSWFSAWDNTCADYRAKTRPGGRGEYCGFRAMRAPCAPDTWSMLRGGSWYDAQGRARANTRNYSHPDYRLDNSGFRVMKKGGQR